MTKTKSTKRALLASLLALVVSISMLVGTTFAWFTDNVTSGRNLIQSGNLDIELEYFDGENWVTVGKDTDAFGYDNWEPGFTKVVSFRITNKGSLALKYQLTADVYAETAGVNKAGDSFLLSDYLYTAVVATDADRDTVLATKGVNLKDSYQMSAKSLEKGASEIVALAIWMPTDVDNVANHDGKTVPSIEFGINLVATQEMSESDSFGKDYDKDAPYGTYIELDAGDNLLEAMASAEKDLPLTIKLNGDVEWPTNGHNGFDNVTDASSVVIDGNGKYTLTATGAGVTAIGDDNAPFMLRNLIVKDESVSYEEDSWEFGYLEIGGNELVCENVEFTDPIMVEGSNSKFINCSFVGYTDEGIDDGKAYSMTMYGVWAISGTQVYKNCTFSGTRGLKVCDSNTSNSYASANVDVTVDGCTFDNLSQKPGVAIDYSGDSDITFTVTIKNSDFINCQAGDQNLYVYETDNYIPVTENNRCENYTGEVVYISTKEELLSFAKDINVNGNSYSGRMIKLAADIDLAGIDWEPIGQTGGNGVATYFCGIFDGQGHTISNMTIDGNDTYGEGKDYASGFFGFVDAGDALVKNVNFDKATVSGHHWTGVVVGYLTGKISGCTVTNATVSCTHANDDACGDKAGVIVGYVNSGVVTGNTVIDSTVTSGRDAGQVAGAAKTTQVYGNTIDNATVTATGGCTGANIRSEEIGRVL